MIKKILIANRGEIACRIIRTCKRLGIETVGIYSSSDRNTLHLSQANETYCVGPGEAGDGYLNGDRIIEIALNSNSDAIHPGYGFLSENHAFAQKCIDRGVVFIGPSPDVIKSMGLKSEAKAIMAEAGIPVISGFNPQEQNQKSFLSLAKKIGYPVILKAIAGGGGRGMRIVESNDDMRVALETAKRESLSSFGNEQLIIEKYIKSARHIEVQILGDNFGNIIHLFERECSLQRRHQKVIEEAPAPDLQQSIRKKLFEAAISGGKTIGYSGVGTFEFLVEPDGQFWFLEMNTRIQVEHPVTEFITGLDIVELQIRVASGEKLPGELKVIQSKGHAIEARLYSENADFTPSFGKLYHLGLPTESRNLRIDHGVREGDEITLNYDPMIAKVISHGTTREKALNIINEGLNSLRTCGPSTNERFLISLINNPKVMAGDFDTRFIEENLLNLQPSQDIPNNLLAISAYALITKSMISRDGYSPWFDTSGWRLGSSIGKELKLLSRKNSWRFALKGNALTILDNDISFKVEGEWTSHRDFKGIIDQDEYVLEIYNDGDDFTVFIADQKLQLKRVSDFQAARKTNTQSGTLISPMPGIIVNIFVKKGQKVKAGTPLLVLEAMKTEHVIRSPHAGKVGTLNFSIGDQVSEGIELLKI